MDLPLKHPLTFGKITISKLTFRDYTTGGDYLAFDKPGGVAQAHALIASMTGSAPELVEQLRGSDYRAAAKIADAMIAADDVEEAGGPEKKSSES